MSIPQKIQEEFIEIYKSEPCLWKRNSADYSNQKKKRAAYQKLMDKLRQIEPEADRNDVAKKINNMRSVYRKELRKVTASQRLGDGSYVPQLWYFEKLNFLLEEHAMSHPALSLSQQPDFSWSDDNDSQESSSSHDKDRSPTRTDKTLEQKQEVLITTPTESCETETKPSVISSPATNASNYSNRTSSTSKRSFVNPHRMLEEFIEIYKSEPCLWKVKHKHYHNGRMKSEAYEKLVHKLREIEPEADRKDVVKKINNLRSVYRRELNKVKRSQKSDEDEIYRPKLWYFDQLNFLDEEVRAATAKSKTSLSNSVLSSEDQIDFTWDDSNNKSDEVSDDNVDSIDEDELSYHSPHLSDDDNMAEVKTFPLEKEQDCVPCPENTPTSAIDNDNSMILSPDRQRKRKRRDWDKEVFLALSEHLKSRRKPAEDRFDLYGKYLAQKLRELDDNTQRILLEKVIGEAVFQAEMGTLTPNHRLTNTDDQLQ